MVSVVCLTYNHAGYIRDALEGFVAQRAPWRFEVIVHDDASADGTAETVREYERRYPELIRGVYQTENRYSQGVDIPRTFLYPLIRGRYVALCEGDDYWTDPHKLEKQVAALEAHPEVDICAHRALQTRDGRPMGHVAPAWRDGVISAKRVILGGGNFVATASLLCRRETYLQRTPMREILANDYSLQIQGSLRGGLYYLHDCMSVYRKGTPGSWSARKGSLSEAFVQKRREMLEALDAYTEGRYRRSIRRRLRRYDAAFRRAAAA